MRLWKKLFGAGKEARRALIDAIHRGDSEEVRSLLAQGVNPNRLLAHRGRLPSLPLVDAAWRGHLEILEALVEAGAKIDNGLMGFNAIHAAAARGHVETVRLLLERGAAQDPDRDGSTPLDYAKQDGHYEVVALLEGREWPRSDTR